MLEIDRILRECISQTVNRSPAYCWGGVWGYIEKPRPWKGELASDYQVVNWRLPPTDSYFLADNSFEIDEIPLQSYDDLPDLKARFYEDLEYYQSQRMKQLREIIAKDKSDLELMESLKKEGYAAIQYDQEGKVHGYNVDTIAMLSVDQAIRNVKKDLLHFQELVPGEEHQIEEYRDIADEAFEKIDDQFREIFLWCLENHQPEGIAFNGALEDFLSGDFDRAIQHIQELIDRLDKNEFDLIAKLYMLKGRVQNETGRYADAIVNLTEAIGKNPAMKDAYFDRAVAYFELGQFERAIQDYLGSGLHPTIPTNPMEWGLGIAAGLAAGGAGSLADFFPSLLGTLRGVSNGLWALANHPLNTSQEFISAVQTMVSYLQTHSVSDAAQDMVPEIRTLIQRGDQLSGFEKGRLMGQAIGKYGTDILLAKYGTAGLKAYCELKKANQLMTLEALASPEQKQLIMAEATKRWATREQAVKNGNLTINLDKQGKHIEGHKNYMNLVRNNEHPSILTHPDPEMLVREYAGTGFKITGKIPGEAGYKEIVNFGEVIGYNVHLVTGVRTITSWGKIHYAKKGAHIVPTIPRG